MAGIVLTLVVFALVGWLALYFARTIENGDTPEVVDLGAKRRRFDQAMDYYAEKYHFFSDRFGELYPTPCGKKGCLCPRCQMHREKRFLQLPSDASPKTIAWFFGKFGPKRPSPWQIARHAPIFPLTIVPTDSHWLRFWYVARYWELHACPYCHVVFSHRLNAWAWPQVWQKAFLDPAVPLAVQAQPARLADNTTDTSRAGLPAQDVTEPGVSPQS